MVKTFKYILIRIIIGVGIALILMYLKGGLISNVSALEVKTFETTNNQNFVSCSGCNVINEAWNWSSGLTNVSGILLLNAQVTTSASSYPPTFVLARITIDNKTYNCNINGYGNLSDRSASSGAATTQTGISSYSLSCPVSFGANGQFQRIYLQANGTIPDSISVYSPMTFIYDNNQQEVINAIEDNTDAQNETNETLKDDSIDDSKAENDINDMKDKVASNGSITQLLTLPITLYQSILNSLNGSCSSFSLGSLYNHNLTLPCINLQNLLGSTLYNIIDILCCGSFILVFRKRMVDIFNHMTSLNDRGNEVE